MIRANKGGPLGAAWAYYVDQKIRRAFRGLWLRGELPVSDEPLLVYANHSSFWDGFIAHALSRATATDGYCLMEEHNLRRYPFLARLGAFSIRRHDGVSSLESLRYARELLSRPRARVFVFPTGQLQPFGALDIPLERGIEVLTRLSGARAIPVAFRCAFFEDELPDVLVEVGTPHGPAPLSHFAAQLDTLVQRLGNTPSPEGFVRLVKGRAGVAQRWDAIREGRINAT